MQGIRRTLPLTVMTAWVGCTPARTNYKQFKRSHMMPMETWHVSPIVVVRMPTLTTMGSIDLLLVDMEHPVAQPETIRAARRMVMMPEAAQLGYSTRSLDQSLLFTT